MARGNSDLSLAAIRARPEQKQNLWAFRPQGNGRFIGFSRLPWICHGHQYVTAKLMKEWIVRMSICERVNLRKCAFQIAAPKAGYSMGISQQIWIKICVLVCKNCLWALCPRIDLGPCARKITIGFRRNRGVTVRRVVDVILICLQTLCAPGCVR